MPPIPARRSPNAVGTRPLVSTTVLAAILRSPRGPTHSIVLVKIRIQVVPPSVVTSSAVMTAAADPVAHVQAPMCATMAIVCPPPATPHVRGKNVVLMDAFKDLACYGIIAQIVQNGKWGK